MTGIPGWVRHEACHPVWDGCMPFPMYGPSAESDISPEQEREWLNEQAEILKKHLEEIKDRLEELKENSKSSKEKKE